jgi:hypothetical protein
VSFKPEFRTKVVNSSAVTLTASDPEKASKRTITVAMAKKSFSHPSIVLRSDTLLLFSFTLAYFRACIEWTKYRENNKDKRSRQGPANKRARLSKAVGKQQQSPT